MYKILIAEMGISSHSYRCSCRLVVIDDPSVYMSVHEKQPDVSPSD
jgi:hypothetical protein